MQDDQIGFKIHGSPDSDPLTFTSGKLTDSGFNGNAFTAEADGVEHNLIRHGFFFLNVDKPKAIHNLAPDKKIPPQNLFFAERSILIDTLYAVGVSASDIISTKFELPAGNIQFHA